MRSRSNILLFPLVLWLLLCLGCDGYTAVHGTIRDGAGALVAGATVVFNAKGSAYPKKVTSAADGTYRVGSTHGWWHAPLTLVVSKEGYRSVEQEFNSNGEHTREINIVLLKVLSQPPANSQEPHGISTSDKVGGVGTFKLPDGSQFVTTLYDLKVVGTLITKKKLPYYVLSGIGCNGCDANTSIYIHSPSDGAMKNEGEQPRFSYPGQQIDYQSGKVVSENRVFLGDCLPSHPNAVIWFYRT
jgi:hypothetical protein